MPQSLEKKGQRKLLTDKQRKLLEKAMSSIANATKKKSKCKVIKSAKEQIQCWTSLLLMFKSRGWLLL